MPSVTRSNTLQSSEGDGGEPGGRAVSTTLDEPRCPRARIVLHISRRLRRRHLGLHAGVSRLLNGILALALSTH